MSLPSITKLEFRALHLAVRAMDEEHVVTSMGNGSSGCFIDKTT